MYVINTTLNSLILSSKTKALHDFNLNLTQRKGKKYIHMQTEIVRQFYNIQLCEQQLNTSFHV